MVRRPNALLNLFRGRIRMSMNKSNLYNMYKQRRSEVRNKTQYQQIHQAKTETRAYHGEHIPEKLWKKMFNQKLQGVAQLDASIGGKKVEPTPLALQTYASLEKRLEFAVFRAMFASSLRQARQFILKGYVTVNGIRVMHPRYPLSPGDVFAVVPDQVMYALGRERPSLAKSIQVTNKQITEHNSICKKLKQNPTQAWEELQKRNLVGVEAVEGKEANLLARREFNNKLQRELKEKQNAVTGEGLLAEILANEGNYMSNGILFPRFNSLEISQKAGEIFKQVTGKSGPVVTAGAFGAEVAKASKLPAPSEDVTAAAKKTADEFLAVGEENSELKDIAENKRKVRNLLSGLRRDIQNFYRAECDKKTLAETHDPLPFNKDAVKDYKRHPLLHRPTVKENESAANVRLPGQNHLWGRQDPSKKYFTPWTPRGFLGVFAILPSHIEVSFDTCHAVYIRDPVARPGQSEVLSPFPLEVHERAFMYYV